MIISEDSSSGNFVEPLKSKKWMNPLDPLLKCNVGISWSKRNKIVRGAWVLRDCRDEMTLYSRRCFSSINSLDEVKITIMLWAIESMSSHHIDKVIFASDAIELVDALEKPQAWPFFSHQVSELMHRLNGFRKWLMIKEAKDANIGACLIAQSVTQDGRFCSYVASGHPSWLHGLFESESVHPSV